MIYLIANKKARACKIGFSKNPNRRLVQLRTASPTELVLLATIDGTVWEERALHEKFACDRMSGEWFKMTPELLAHFGVEEKPKEIKAKPKYDRVAITLETIAKNKGFYADAFARTLVRKPKLSSNQPTPPNE